MDDDIDEVRKENIRLKAQLAAALRCLVEVAARDAATVAVPSKPLRSPLGGNNSVPVGERFLSPADIARRLRVPTSVVREMIAQLEIPCEKVGHRWQISEAAFAAWFASTLKRKGKPC